MRKDCERLFDGLRRADPPARLLSAIITRINIAKRRTAIIKFALCSSASFLSSLVIVVACVWAAQSFYETGFEEYVRLMVSDSALVATYWQDFILSLVESLPILEVALLLLATLSFLGFARLAIRNIKNASLSILTN